jgi:hypothetical protein
MKVYPLRHPCITYFLGFLIYIYSPIFGVHWYADSEKVPAMSFNTSWTKLGKMQVDEEQESETGTSSGALQ